MKTSALREWLRRERARESRDRHALMLSVVCGYGPRFWSPPGYEGTGISWMLGLPRPPAVRVPIVGTGETVKLAAAFVRANGYGISAPGH